MRTAQRVFVNTLALYAKIIINVFISFFLTRLVLNALGVNDYGIYNLIAGTIAFLSFLNSALASSSQRYFSVLKGKNDLTSLRQYFSVSVVIHLLLSVLLVLIFEISYVFVFDGFFNIDADRIESAKVVYQLTCLSMIATVCGVPYTSIINANEDLVFYSLVESLCSIFKLGIIFIFKIPDVNLLIAYTAWITLVTLLGVVIKWYWCKKKYPECNHISFGYNKVVSIKMLSFSGWNSLGAFAMMCRSQGIAFVINIYWGTAINAVYGIANQVSGQLSYFSQMLSASFAPQIMKSVGENNYSKLRFLSVFSSKIAFFMSAIFAIPLILQIDYVLNIWLENVPNYTAKFCVLIIYVFLILQLYPGLVRAIQAVGKIRNYQIVISILLIIPIIIGSILFKNGYESYSICYVMIIAQVLSLCATTLFAKKLFNLDLYVFYRYIIISILGFFLVIISFMRVKFLFFENFAPFWRFVLVTVLSMSIFSMYFFMVMLTSEERKKLFSLIKK